MKQIMSFVTTQQELEDLWKMSRQKVRSTLTALKCLGYIATKAVTKGFDRYTVLTINTLADTNNQGIFENATNKQKENLQKENTIPPKKSPQGDVCVKGSSKLSKQIHDALDECKAKWHKACEAEEIKKEVKRYWYYRPSNLAELCSSETHIQIINTNQEIAKVSDESMTMMQEFFELHVFSFVVNSGMQYKMTPQEFQVLAEDLRLQSKKLNIGHVALFFYLLLHPDYRVGNID